MLPKYLLFLFINFPHFLLKKLPLNLLHLYSSFFYELDSTLGFRLNLHLFFTPLFGKNDWALRVAAFMYRFYKVSFGFVGILIFSFCYFIFSILIIFLPIVTLFLDLNYFLVVIFLYITLYLIYYFFNPYEVVNYSKLTYAYFDIYKMCDYSSRQTFTSLIAKKRIKKHLQKLSLYLEKDLYELEDYFNNISFNRSSKIVDSIISLAKFASYRHISQQVVVCGLLSTNYDFLKYLENSNLNPRVLITFLVTLKNEYTHNSPKKWDVDYVSNYLSGYNASKLDSVTPNLNKYSLIFAPKTKILAFSFLPTFKKYKLTLVNTLTSGSKKVLIIGNPGEGKTSIVEDFYNDLRHGRIRGGLNYSRIVNLDLSRIVSQGTDGLSVLTDCLKEFSSLKNTILFLDNLHILYSYEGLDYISVLTPYLENENLKIIATTDDVTFYSRVNKESSLNTLFTKIRIEEMSGTELYDFLTLKNWDLKYKLTIPAINLLSSSTPQILFDMYNPQKSLKIIEEATKFVENTGLITISQIDQTIKKLTGISFGEVSNFEKQELTNLKSKISKEVVGQEAAVSSVVDSLIRVVAMRNRSSNKPIASFLFAGPTGVGKTELAKSLARNFFKGEGKIIRIDMSEYQTAESINRLIGSEDGKKDGILTTAVKENPFNLVLLDELEKASYNIQMLFLQVLDDGRLTTSSGVTVSFKNIILIATTNAGTQNVINDFSKGITYEDVKEKFLVNLKTAFPPEFLNRFTDIILFNPLNKNVFGEVLTIKFNKIKNEFFNEHKISLSLDPGLKGHLIDQSYDKEWGARALERVLEKTITTTVSKAYLSGDLKSGDSILIDKDFVVKYTNT